MEDCFKYAEFPPFTKASIDGLPRPYRSGSSFHGAPLLAIHSIPFTILRLSYFAGRPCFPYFGCSGGNISLIRSHCSSVISYLRILISQVYIIYPNYATFIFQTSPSLKVHICGVCVQLWIDLHLKSGPSLWSMHIPSLPEAAIGFPGPPQLYSD